MKYLIAFLAVILLIVVHEFGHYLVGRAVGARLDEYAIGFGPKLISHVSKKSGIRYSLRAVPLGGFCAFSDDENDPGYLAKLPKWKQILTFIAGPAMNYLVASVLVIVVFVGLGVPLQTNVVDSTKAGYHASKELENGDVITKINGTQVDTADGLDNAIANVGKDDVTLTVYRPSEDKSFDTIVTPREVQTGSGIYDLMIIRQTQNVRVPVMYGVIQGFSYPAEITAVTLKTLGNMIVQHNVDSFSSPVALVQTVGEYARVSQLPYFLLYMAIISVSVGLMNLLPLPGLDGSKILFRIIEAITHKEMSQDVEYKLSIGCMICLVVLSGYLIIRDANGLINQLFS